MTIHSEPAIVHTVQTPFGAFTLIVDEQQRVLAAGFNTTAPQLTLRMHPSVRPTRSVAGVASAGEAVAAYLEGETDAIAHVTVVQRGTALQQQGWATLREIEPGEPLSYAQFAERLGRPTAVRAAASICARNAVALFVPCHRVLRADGSLGGYAWGEDVKRGLLEWESR